MIDNKLKFIINKRYDQTFSMRWINEEPDKLSYLDPHNIRVYNSGEIKGISKITRFKDDVEGENNNQFLKKYFKYKSGDAWSDQKPIEELENLEVDFRLPFEIQLIYYYVYNESPRQYGFTNILLKDINIEGEYALTLEESEAKLDDNTPEVLLRPKDIYKVFRLDGFEIIKQQTSNADYEIYFRFTQNGGRTYTPYEPLTQDNIKTLKLDELRFAQVEYFIKLKSSDSALVIYDIMLKGNFQNVSANYLKTNRYGLKQDCISFIAGSEPQKYNDDIKWSNSNCSNAFPSDRTNFVEYQDGSDNNEGFQSNDFIDLNFTNIETKGLSTYVTSEDIQYNQGYDGVGGFWGVGGSEFNGGIAPEGGFWNPYVSNKIVSFQNMLANHTNSIFGWRVNYFLTDPDGNGIDRFLNEYQLKHVVKVEQLKVIVPDNNFPDESLKINFFNLDIFDTFEINILKDEFKRAFGVEKRPSQDDIIHLCITNKLYYIKHAQALRDVMNASIYYKVILEKYEKRKDINIQDEESQNLLNELTDNTTIDEVLGDEKKQETDKVANKSQTFPLTYDKIRQQIYEGVHIIKDNLTNDNIVISDSYYDLSKRKGKIAIDYSIGDYKLIKGENRTFISWFKPKSKYDPNKHLSRETFKGYYIDNNPHELINNYDEENKQGYLLAFEPDNIVLWINNNSYSLTTDILTDVWYSILVSLDQRQHKLNIELYRRYMDILIVMFNKDSYEKKEMITYDTPENAFDPDDPEYTYENALNDGFLPVSNNETNYYLKEDDKYGKLQLVDSKSIDITPFEFDHNTNFKLNGSNIYYTNMRVFDDIINNNDKTNILSQSIVKDEQHLIMYDNADRIIYATTRWSKKFN